MFLNFLNFLNFWGGGGGEAPGRCRPGSGEWGRRNAGCALAAVDVDAIVTARDADDAGGARAVLRLAVGVLLAGIAVAGREIAAEARLARGSIALATVPTRNRSQAGILSSREQPPWLRAAHLLRLPAPAQMPEQHLASLP